MFARGTHICFAHDTICFACGTHIALILRTHLYEFMFFTVLGDATENDRVFEVAHSLILLLAVLNDDRSNFVRLQEKRVGSVTDNLCLSSHCPATHSDN